MRWKQSAIGLAIACFLALCGCFGSDDGSYPALEKGKLAGCWVQNPGRASAECAEYCFSVTGKEYAKFVYAAGASGKVRFVELYGSYSISGANILNGSYVARNNVDSQSDTSGGEGGYTIIRDTLNAIGPNGNLDPYARRDTTNNCGPHWQLFSRPADWELP